MAAAAAAGVGRFVLVSSMFADRPDVGPAFLREVLAFKRIGEHPLTASALAWTILRPGGLVDGPGTGRVTAGHSPHGTPGMLPRTDLATSAVACLAAPNTIGAGIDLVAGETLIATALAAL